MGKNIQARFYFRVWPVTTNVVFIWTPNLLIGRFRYNARSLFRILEDKYYEREWPHQEFDMGSPSGIDLLVDKILQRINTASGPYQMYYTLGDAVVFFPPSPQDSASPNPASAGVTRYYEEMPADYFAEKYHKYDKMMVMFGFDGQRRSISESLRGGTGFEPWLWFLPAGINGERGERKMLQMQENIHTGTTYLLSYVLPP
jgi:hypothetical protein